MKKSGKGGNNTEAVGKEGGEAVGRRGNGREQGDDRPDHWTATLQTADQVLAVQEKR